MSDHAGIRSCSPYLLPADSALASIPTIVDPGPSIAEASIAEATLVEATLVEATLVEATLVDTPVEALPTLAEAIPIVPRCVPTRPGLTVTPRSGIPWSQAWLPLAIFVAGVAVGTSALLAVM